jgi:DNA mismatch repair protein MutS
MREYSSKVVAVAEYVRAIDLLQSRCYIATKYGYCKPVIAEGSTRSFVQASGLRHPLIEHIQTNELYVTNDISLGKETDPRGMLLFGTNAVGKTSLIKSLGIAVIMAQAGLYVACSDFVYSPYTSIFTRILGNDNLHRGLSTFAVEMIELRTILKLADENSLILGDELCSGTESDSALSIFAAGVEHLHETESSFIFATHFHEIVGFDEIKDLDHVCTKHLTVEYDKSRDVLVYDRKLKDGPGDRMYGLEVCKALDLPTAFLERAHTLRNKYNGGCEDVLEGKSSHFNVKRVMGACELCNAQGTEVHHLQHQKNADGRNRIKHFHKNHVANLVTLCSECHDTFHETDTQYSRKKTSAGYKLYPLDLEA